MLSVATRNGLLKFDDASEILALMIDVWQMRTDPRQWRRHLLEGLCRVLGAHVGVTSNTRNHSPTSRPRLDLLVDFGWRTAAQRQLYFGHVKKNPLKEAIIAAVVAKNGGAKGSAGACTREQLISDEAWYANPEVESVYKPADLHHALYWTYFGHEPGMTMCVRMFRPWKGGVPFTQREISLLELAGLHLPRLYIAEVRPQGKGKAIPPRPTQILHLLLAGKSERQIADMTDLSPHTVHGYIKDIYKHYKVSSRSELLSRFIGRKREMPAPLLSA